MTLNGAATGRVRGMNAHGEWTGGCRDVGQAAHRLKRSMKSWKADTDDNC